MAKTTIDERIKRLKSHLEQENPPLAEVVDYFRQLDKIARRLGFMDADSSFATQIAWWPVVSVLGTFSAGKSTFLNEFLGVKLQRTGNQAVDDKFTVMCFSSDSEVRELPGLALDSDPRFPFYQISDQIDEATEGEGKRIDSYLQLKTCNADHLRGKIFIDSPGFDADEQRSATLLITDHIIGLSDLVLVFFDARHPEPGAMMDTLKHLVAETINRPDSDKFLYVLNQIDNAAREDNPEEVVAAWQRALAKSGLTAGRFYRIYSQSAAVTIPDEQVLARLQSKRDEDLADIKRRITQLNVDRAYRITRMLEYSGEQLRDVLVPKLTGFVKLWRQRTRLASGGFFALVAVLFLYWSLTSGAWNGLTFMPLANLSPFLQVIAGAGVLAIAFGIHLWIRGLTGRTVLYKIRRDNSLPTSERDALLRGFESNRRSQLPILSFGEVSGWSVRLRKKLDGLIDEADLVIQKLNDIYASPSGETKK